MRIVTRPDFDGIACAVLLRKAENIDQDILWAEPNEIQRGQITILKDDIMANLPWSPDCGLWFDHHITNRPAQDFQGAFAIAPSTAGVIYKYYKKIKKINNNYNELVLNTDIIDAADLNIDQVRYPENYPYILLSITVRNQEYRDIPYWNRLVDLLMETDIDHVMADPEVKKRGQNVIKENAAFEKNLLAYTKVINQISITDFRPFARVPEGNRFLIYSLFPETIASVKIQFDGPEHKNIQLSVGHNIIRKQCRVNIGNLLAGYGGGGHARTGGCTLEAEKADKIIEEILETLFQNRGDI